MSEAKISFNLRLIPIFQSTDDWNIHREKLQKYFNSNSIYADKRKISVLISSIDKKVYQKLHDLCHPVFPFFKTYDELSDIMKNHYSHQVSSLEMRKRFNKLQQSNTESINEWYQRLKKAANGCNFGDQLEEMMKEQFVLGMRDGEILESLMKEDPRMSLQNIIKFALEKEAPVIDKLNEDCLIHIFSFLPIADRLMMKEICEFWQLAAKQTWRNVKEIKMEPKFLGLKPIRGSFQYPIIDIRMLEAILISCGRYLEKIEYPEYDCPLTTIAKYCPNIKSIKCNKASLLGLKILSESCKNIEEISINSNIYEEFDEALEDLFSNNKKLKIVNFPFYCIERGDCLLKLPYLYHINMEHFSKTVL